METVTVELVHDANPDHLAKVKAIMIRRGSPRIRVYGSGDSFLALEGSHRLTAAAELGIPVKLVVMRDRERMRHDFQDLPPRCTVKRIIDYLCPETTMRMPGPSVQVDAEIYE